MNGNPFQQAATITHIAVRGGDQDLDVEIAATVPITALTTTATDPDRLIVDVPHSVPGAALHRITVNRGKLRNVRVGLLSASPRITRVVLDLVRPTQYRVLPLGNTILVKLGEESESVGATPKAPVEPKSTETTSVAVAPWHESPQPSRARWIFPILLTATVLAMIVVSVVAHMQNKRGRRGP